MVVSGFVVVGWFVRFFFSFFFLAKAEMGGCYRGEWALGTVGVEMGLGFEAYGFERAWFFAVWRFLPRKISRSKVVSLRIAYFLLDALVHI